MIWLGIALAGHPQEPVVAALEFPSAPRPEDLPRCPVRFMEIGVTGDLMTHDRQLEAALQPDGTYDFSGVFDRMAPYFHSPDVMAGNLETVLGGEDLGWSGGSTGTPGVIRFNTPTSVLDALDAAGFDVLQTANNHSFDRFELGVIRTVDAVEAAGFAHTGTYRTPEERSAPWAWVAGPGGIDVAFIAYAEVTENPVGGTAQFLVNKLDLPLIAHDVRRARAAGADLVVVALHWGLEFRHEPEAYQRRWAAEILASGADVIWGTHPHVLQPVEVWTVDDPAGPRDALVMFSLGNVVSNQRTPNRDGGVLVRFTVAHCEEPDRTWLAGARLTPYWVDASGDGGPRYRVTPIPPDDSACALDGMTAADCARSGQFRAHAAEILPAGSFDWSPEPATFDWPLRPVGPFAFAVAQLR